MNQQDTFITETLDNAWDVLRVHSLPEYTYRNSLVNSREYVQHYRENVSYQGRFLLASLSRLNKRNPKRATLLAAAAAVGCLHPDFLLAKRLEEVFYEYLLQDNLSLQEKRAICKRLSPLPGYSASLKGFWNIIVDLLLQAARENPLAVASELRQHDQLTFTPRKGQMPRIFLTQYLKEYFELGCLMCPVDKQLSKALMLAVLDSRGHYHSVPAPEDTPDYRFVSETLYELEKEDEKPALTDSAEIYASLLKYGFPDAYYWDDVLHKLCEVAVALEHKEQKEKTISYAETLLYLAFYSQENSELRASSIQRLERITEQPENYLNNPTEFFARACGYFGRKIQPHRNPTYSPDITHPAYALATNAYWSLVKGLCADNQAKGGFDALNRGLYEGDEVLGEAIANFFLAILPKMTKVDLQATKSALHWHGQGLFSTYSDNVAYQKEVKSIIWLQGLAILEKIDWDAAVNVRNITVHPLSRL